MNPFVLDQLECAQLSALEVDLHCLTTEWDEFWSYVGSKANQRWTWYLRVCLTKRRVRKLEASS